MMNPGWCVFQLVEGRRQFVAEVREGQPVFTPNEAMARFGDEYAARQLKQIVERQCENVRLMYIPRHVRESWIDARKWFG